MSRIKSILTAGICFLLILGVHYNVQAEIQTISLYPGWNLISFQLEPLNPGINTLPSLLKSQITDESDPEAFICIWGYDAYTESWKTCQADSSALNNMTSVSLQKIEAKKGYWLKVSRFVELKIEGTIAKGPISFTQGWNLVGFTGFGKTYSEKLGIKEVFGAYMDFIDQIWIFDAKNTQRFKGYDLHANPPIMDFHHFETGTGYWIYALEGFTLSPILGVTLFPDMDVAPFDNFPGPEDKDIDGDGVFDSGAEQEIIFFGEIRIGDTITIINEGSGILNWKVKTDTDWIDFDYYQGATCDETDKITVYCIRDGLLPGTYEGQLILESDNTERVIQVKMVVPPLKGDYQGSARIDFVNGKPADLANEDLYLSIFVDEDNVNGLNIIKGVLNANRTVIFPIDFSVLGCHYLYQSNKFVFNGGFSLPPSDIDNPPFNQVPSEDDIDWNDDGKFDRINPLPFSIERELTLVGDRVTDTILEGEYFEVIKNALPYPIYLQGTFFLNRVKSTPSKFTPLIQAKDFTYNQIGEECRCGSCGGGEEIGDNDGTELESTLEITDPFIIDELNVRIKICHLRTSDLEIILVSPSSTEVILHQGIGGENIDTVYDTYTMTSGDLADFRDEPAEGTWILKVKDSVSDVSGKLIFWRLEFIKNQIPGKVIDEITNEPISGARVTLNGAVIVQSYKTSSEGTYRFTGLQSGAYSIKASKLGYQDKIIDLWIYNGDINIPNEIALTPISLEEDFMAAPTFGQDPLRVEFTAFPPSNISNPEYLWDFGDGSAIYNTSSKTATHVYDYTEDVSDPNRTGIFSVTLTIRDLDDSNNNVEISRQNLIIVKPTPDSDMGSECYMFQYSFSGGGNDTQETAADMASFDIDRPPYDNDNFPGKEDTDYENNGRYDEYLVDPGEDPKKFRMITNIGSAISGTCLMGDKVLSVGLISY